MQADITIHINKNGWGNAPDVIRLIDLGLPSGTLWANANLGFKGSFSDLGKRYSWGTLYNQENDYINNEDPNSPGNTAKMFRCQDEGYCDGICFTKQFDAAHKEWGGNWRTPSIYQYKELIDLCDAEFYDGPNHHGWKFISRKNGNILYIPEFRFKRDENGKFILLDHTDGYWTRTYALKEKAWAFGSNGRLGGECNYSMCKTALPIRPVWMPDLK